MLVTGGDPQPRCLTNGPNNRQTVGQRGAVSNGKIILQRPAQIKRVIGAGEGGVQLAAVRFCPKRGQFRSGRDLHPAGTGGGDIASIDIKKRTGWVMGGGEALQVSAFDRHGQWFGNFAQQVIDPRAGGQNDLSGGMCETVGPGEREPGGRLGDVGDGVRDDLNTKRARASFR